MNFDPDELLRVLVEHGVRFVVVGGLAATLHGAADVTLDADVVPERTAANLNRLSDALRALDARIRTEPGGPGFQFNHDAESLNRSEIWNLTTDFGDLDVIFAPAGIGFAELFEQAEQTPLAAATVLIASLDDIIRLKEAAGREKDLARLPGLRRLREVLRKRDAGQP